MFKGSYLVFITIFIGLATIKCQSLERAPRPALAEIVGDFTLDNQFEQSINEIYQQLQNGIDINFGQHRSILLDIRQSLTNFLTIQENAAKTTLILSSLAHLESTVTGCCRAVNNTTTNTNGDVDSILNQLQDNRTSQTSCCAQINDAINNIYFDLGGVFTELSSLRGTLTECCKTVIDTVTNIHLDTIGIENGLEDLKQCATSTQQNMNARFQQTWTILNAIQENQLDCSSTPLLNSAYINTPGNYCLMQNISQIQIDADNVTIDLNGFCITGSQACISILPNHNTIRLFNGMLSGAHNGIEVQEGVEDIQFEHLHIEQCVNGIDLRGSVDNPIARVRIDYGNLHHNQRGINCLFVEKAHISNSDSCLSSIGFFAAQSTQIIYEKCCANNNSQAGFSFDSTSHCQAKDCKAINIGASDDANAFGFVSVSGMDNSFDCCSAKSIETSNPADCAFAAGFALLADEKNSFIIECIAKDIRASGQAQAYGIFLEDNNPIAIESYVVNDTELSPILAHGTKLVRYNNQNFESVSAQQSVPCTLKDIALHGSFQESFYDNGMQTNAAMPIIFSGYSNVIEAFDAHDLSSLSALTNLATVVRSLELSMNSWFFGNRLYASGSNTLHLLDNDLLVVTDQQHMRGVITDIAIDGTPYIESSVIYVAYENKVKRFGFDQQLIPHEMIVLPQKVTQIVTNDEGDLLFVMTGNTVTVFELINGALIQQDSFSVRATIKSTAIQKDQNIVIFGFEDAIESYQWDDITKKLEMKSSLNIDEFVHVVQVGVVNNLNYLLIAAGSHLYSGLIDNQGGIDSISQVNTLEDLGPSVTGCLVKNCTVCQSKATINGTGIQANGYLNLIINNMGYFNEVNYGCLIPNVFYGSITATTDNMLINYSFPPV